ncbi:hypothetical protein KKA47_04300 [bacterium]|nr:hypothetical protein [bacterium]
MKTSHYTLQERKLINLMRWLLVIFCATFIAFIFQSKWIIAHLNYINSTFFKLPWENLDPSVSKFWLVLGTSFIFMLGYIAFLIQSDIVRNIRYSVIIILSMFVMSASYGILMLLEGLAFPYLAASTISGILFLLTLLYYTKSVSSRV